MQAKNYFILFSFFFFSTHSFAQEGAKILPITLESVIQFSGAENPNIKIIQQRQQLATAEQKTASEWWIPNIYAGVTMHQLNGAAMNSDGIFFLDVDRQNFWGGVGAFTELDLGKGIFELQAAKEKSKAVQFQSQAEKEYFLLKAIHAYFDLQGAQAQWAGLKRLEEESENIVRQLEAHTEAGFSFKSDLLLAKSNFNHHRIGSKKAEAAVKRNSAHLVSLLNLGADIQLLSADTVLAAVRMVNGTEMALTAVDAYNNRPDFKNAEGQMLAMEKAQLVHKGGLLLPKVQLGVSYGQFGDLFSPTDRDNNPIDNLYNTFEFNGALLWEIPLNEAFGGGQNRIYNSKLQIQKSELEILKNTIRAEVDAAKAETIATHEALGYATESLSFASEALRQSMERQKLRTATPYEVFQAQEFYLSAQIDFIESVIDYNKSQYSLYVALGKQL